jgi:hypothetical protein
MTRYLLDTNVLSETRKAAMNPMVHAFLSEVNPDSLYVSALSIGELCKGVQIKRQSDPTMADRLQLWVDAMEQNFSDSILPISMDIAKVWGQLSADRSRPVIDTLLAATAIVHDLVLVTRNVKDFQGVPVITFDPFRAQGR